MESKANTLLQLAKKIKLPFWKGKLIYVLSKVIGKKRSQARLIIGDYTIPLDLSVRDEIGLFLSDGASNNNDAFYFFKSLLKKNDVFYDIGANIGMFSIYALTIDEVKVFSFEPNKFLADNLIKIVNGNPMIRIFNIGVSDKESVLNFTINSKFHALSNFRSHKSSIGQPINVKSIDLLLEKKELLPPTVIKIDTEGYEMNVLNGYQQIHNHKPIIILEWIDHFMKEMGYDFDSLLRIFPSEEWHILRIQNDKTLSNLNSPRNQSSNDLMIIHKSDKRFDIVKHWIDDSTE